MKRPEVTIGFVQPWIAYADSLEAELDKLRLRSQAVVDDAMYPLSKKPNTTDSYGINAQLLWLLAKELEADDE